ncbi:protein adenylyltransferase SelO [Hydrogenophilus thiooxidans]|uniref:protein adenylyltransferase SelO n=1 Tax=Hydrogenophilus thiooxidans TaxID=2820326 RepID=UPI001C21C069|nr:YdiU family protein [Hydrogenophilus thiooxidans]
MSSTPHVALPPFPFDNSFVRELPDFAIPWQPDPVPAPKLVYLNHELAAELNLPLAMLDEATCAVLFTGQRLPAEAEPVAQAYAGHQFGGFAPMLGDGRALLWGEVIDRHGCRRDLMFKGSGPTPFSRGGDGKAALWAMLKEVLYGEALHVLGIPTTRTLAVATTGEWVMRTQRHPGAILTRVAASHLRVGTFAFFAARGEREKLERLTRYALARHYPERIDDAAPPALALLEAVVERQANLVAQWMAVGFIHGVMNTDNMTISGETIDFGPCAFLEPFDPQTVFSAIDRFGRYAYREQPRIAQWNLARFAEALLPLLDPDPHTAVTLANRVLERFPALYEAAWLAAMRRKLGLTPDGDAETIAYDRALVSDWLELLAQHTADFTAAFRALARTCAGDPAPLRALVPDPALPRWLERWQHRVGLAPGQLNHALAERLAEANPWLIPRNEAVTAALSAAEAGDLAPFERLLSAIQAPFRENPAYADLARPSSPAFLAQFRTTCGT